MPETETTPLTFAAGEPDEHRGVLVVPLFPVREPVADYVTLDEALRRGLRIREADGEGDVPEVVVENPLEGRVLLVDGEELVGAKQNRILSVSVLVEAGTTLPIPVSCVEEGRWSSRSAFFDASPQLAHPDLRRTKAAALQASPLSRGRAQRHVWDEVRAKSARLGVHSRTLAQSDLFAAHDHPLEELARAFELRPGQCGAVLAIGDSLCLDWVSRPEAFDALWPKLRRGYLLDALESLDGTPTPESRVLGFVDEVADAPAARRPSAGLGDDLRLRGPGVVGSGLALGGETLQLSAYSVDDGPLPPLGRLARPSRRRAHPDAR